MRNKKLLESQKREAVCIHKLKDEKDELFKKFHQKFPSKEFIKRIQDPHKTCYVALINEKVAGYGWVASKELFIDSLNYNFPLEEGEFFIFACYVPKENRGQGIYPEMLREILNDGIKRGKERAYIGVSAANAGSIRGIEKAGFEQLRTVRYLQFLSMKKWAGLEKVEA
ncbi:MAG: GNAT family N-acetyltransferase [Balneolaceae bacterium]